MSGDKYVKSAVQNLEDVLTSRGHRLPSMFGVPLNGPSNMFMENEAFYNNVPVPTSTLKKKHLSIAYHRCRESVVAGTVRIAKEGTETNLSDLFTKIFPGPRRETLLDIFTY